MKNLLIVLFLLGTIGCTTQKSVQTGKWLQLFNGRDLNDWQVKITGYPLNENYGNTFRVQDGKMQVNYDQYENFDERYGHIFYKQKFSAYLLAMEYRFTGDQVKGGPGWAFRNSGAMIHSQDPTTMGLKQDFPISIEVQLLGGNGKDERHTANLCTPGTHVVRDNKLFTPHCIDSNSKTFHGDQWVRVEVLVLADSMIQHIVAGDTVLTYFKPQIGGGNVGHHEPAVKKDGQLLQEGFISLQSESHPVEFRKVELFNLEPYLKDSKKLNRVLRQLATNNIKRVEGTHQNN